MGGELNGGTARVNGDMDRNAVGLTDLTIHGRAATGRLAGPVVGAPARRLPPGKIVASVAHSFKKYLSNVHLTLTHIFLKCVNSYQ